LDRILDGAAVINIKGPSWRLREHQALTQPLAQLVDTPDTPPGDIANLPHGTRLERSFEISFVLWPAACSCQIFARSSSSRCL
jgi:hypothetical protein